MNARLVLQEAKVRFWELGVLNRLLDLYGFAPLPAPEEADRVPALTVPLSGDLSGSRSLGGEGLSSGMTG